MSASLIESSQMMVRGRGDSRRCQYHMGGPSQRSSKRVSFNSRSPSGYSYEGFRVGVSSSSGSNQSGTSGSRSGGGIIKSSGRQL